MVFSNEVFLFLFLPAVLLIYYLPFMKNLMVRNVWLLLASLVFYAWGEPVYVFLMILSIVVNYVLGRMVESRARTAAGRRIVAAACIYNLGMLFVFKYMNWILSNFGIHESAFSSLSLPIGISFYTFQALSYVIDVYRGKDKAQKSVMNVGLYIAFFPQLIAGPIVRYNSIAEQINCREHRFDKFSEGVWRFAIGLAKKVLLANRLASLADYAFDSAGSELPAALAWVGALAFMLQIYYDFSGYSDMAIGLGKMFGFEFRENFQYPYISTSVSEYWRRWHISLGEWFRDYLYYPLSLGFAVKVRKWGVKHFNKKAAKIISNGAVLFIVWMATGVWHGANWTFVVWGLLQFICIFIETNRKPPEHRFSKVTGWIYTFMVVMLAKVIFKADNMGHAMVYYGSMLHLNGNEWLGGLGKYWIGQYKIALIAGLIFAFPVTGWIRSLMQKRSWTEKVYTAVQTIVMSVLLIISCAYVLGGGYNPFIYFNF